MLCKHVSTTIVEALLDDGSPVPIHQCDMCGLALGLRPIALVEDTAHLPPIDTEAEKRALTRAWTELLKMP